MALTVNIDCGCRRVKLPTLLRLSSDSIKPDGMYLAENGLQIVMFIGSETKPDLIKQLFGVHSLHELQAPVGELTIPDLGDDASSVNARARRLLDSICVHRHRCRVARPRYFVCPKLS